MFFFFHDYYYYCYYRCVRFLLSERFVRHETKMYIEKKKKTPVVCVYDVYYAVITVRRSAINDIILCGLMTDEWGETSISRTARREFHIIFHFLPSPGHRDRSWCRPGENKQSEKIFPAARGIPFWRAAMLWII